MSSRYNAVWIIFFILGLGTLLPWNFFMTATMVTIVSLKPLLMTNFNGTLLDKSIILWSLLDLECSLEGDTGVDFQTSPVPLPQKKISSHPNPTKKLGENPVPFHSRKNDSHSLPLPCFCVFFCFFWPKSVSYSKNIVQITACPP